jgi:broad specificity phosphatase PhoE
MELVFVRHALPVRLEQVGADAPPADPGLAPLGAQQAARLAALLTREPLDAVYVSPARRAIESALPLLNATGVPAVTEEGLAELDAAESSYIPVEELKAADDPRWRALLRGEHYDASVDVLGFRERVVEAVEGIVARHPGQRVVVFTHAGTINAYAGHLLGQCKPFWLAMTQSPGYCSISRIAAARDGRRSIISLNETSHLRDLLSL